MDAEKIRELIRAAPFREFSLVMEDGRRLIVDKPYYLAMADDGSVLVHASTDGGFERFGAHRVVGVEFPKANGAGDGRQEGQ
jgi:hypothetical protein